MQMVKKDIFLAPAGLKVGDELISGENVELKIGNCLKLKKYSSRYDGS